MLHVYEPTLEAPDSKSPDWYRSYHNSFYLCQLVNKLLLSYMVSFIDKNEKEGIILSKQKELIEQGIITVDKNAGEKIIGINDEKKIYSIAVESFLTEIIEDFKLSANKINSYLMCIGLSAGDYFEKKVEINLEELSESVTIVDWSEIVKGFLNVWEFIFLFSIIESSLKEILGNRLEASKLITEVETRFPNVLKTLESQHNISVELSKKIWDLYTIIRNIYSHTHGVILEKNIGIIKRKIKAFRKLYNVCFHDPKESSDFILSTLLPESGDLFNLSKIKVGKFYLIEDNELNIFRNFSSKFMCELSRDVGRSL